MEIPDDLLREPPADHDEAEHGSEKKVEEVVSGVEGGESNREGS
jgi:hypothetical protein